MGNRMMKWFAFEHLAKGKPRDISVFCATLAKVLDEELAESAEKTAGLRKLLEAKDCLVRAALEDVGAV